MATPAQIEKMKEIFAQGFTDMREVACRMGLSMYTVFYIFNDGLLTKAWGITITDPAEDGPEVNILCNMLPTRVPADAGRGSTVKGEVPHHLRMPAGGYHD